MNKNICFIELIKDENGFFKAGQTVETACIRAYLKENEIDSMIYVDESLPSISDMCDDILSLSDEILVFVVHEECKGIMKVLISCIKELEDVEIYILGDTMDVEDKDIININSEKKLIEVLKGEVDNTNSDFFSVSPYASGILLTRDISKYGIWIGRSTRELRQIDAIKKDINELVKAYSGLAESEDKVIPFIGQFIEDKEYLENVIDKLKNVNISFLKFLLPVHESNFDEVIKMSRSMPQCKYSLKFETALDENKVNSLLALIQDQKIEGIYFPASWLKEKSKFISIIHSESIDIFPIGEVDNKALSPETTSIVLENTRLRYLPFYRGFLNSKIGIYGGDKLDGYVHHLEVSDEFMNKNNNDFINEIMSVNSSVYVKDKKLDIGDEKWLFDEKGIANVDSKSFNNVSDSFSKSNVNLSNFIQVSDHSLYNNTLSYVSDTKIYEISYKEGKRNLSHIKEELKNKEKVVYIFKLVDEEDFKLLLEDAEKYKDSHKLTDLTLAYGYLENSCRFGFSSQCSVSKIPRIKIDSGGNIRTCDMQTEPISKVSDSLFEIEHNCMIKREKKIHEKGCYDCSMSSWCSKCTELPEFMDGMYCEIMKKKSYVLDYTMIPFIYFRLKETNGNYTDIIPDYVIISNEYMYNYIPSEIKGEVAPYLPKFTSLLTINGKCLIWSPATNKYYNVSSELAYIVELLLRRVRAESIPELVSKLLKIDIEKSERIFDFAINAFKKAGVLYREVK
ncbi:hypothetical protein [Clostridium saccharobutylicum]|uniref:Uncharacterized protein n=1 Tax=Clostridium saccharobutylicum DSM 13864 TaxID=1345695 RepID=U5MLE8_CLOSA|nr:hypothetical protein [Clostridium saccharobutylicum]AGX41353.1 hypothetical protein CLSA_c03010 [Clostridium saccharobutylicum DSM 13864]AQR88636.1 hypothetical protein CLOSC_02980 [Clostridium saccharobutylicum]AQR98534.1 hypothetical protein CSACC_02980 [Clostridium saccharobutylicum]AQS12524.1 hypothetical protein CLOSACC_02980 [Clostridium saccharobutylicum]MBA2905542.1 hypothetical protein [Clostridium saccharobutylicum]